MVDLLPNCIGSFLYKFEHYKVVASCFNFGTIDELARLVFISAVYNIGQDIEEDKHVHRWCIYNCFTHSP